DASNLFTIDEHLVVTAPIDPISRRPRNFNFRHIRRLPLSEQSHPTSPEITPTPQPARVPTPAPAREPAAPLTAPTPTERMPRSLTAEDTPAPNPPMPP